jgi:HAD superfamily hydrolase (TIGR01549 family)
VGATEERHPRWICLDVGETLIDESRVWLEWARLLDVPALTFLAAIGATIARGERNSLAFEMVGRPDWHDSLSAFRAEYGTFRESDLYPDAKPAIAALGEQGYRIAIVANQPAERSAELRALAVDAEVMAMSDEIGLWKPDPAFFAHALELMGNPNPEDVAYVGDRLDNDVRPSIASGMRAVWLRRGPWGVIGDGTSAPAETALVVDSLADLVDRSGELWPLPAVAAHG